VTVAVLPEPSETDLVIREQDLKWATSRGSGPGGQNRNKLETAIDLTHLPTGVTVHCESERSQFKNKQSALATLRAKVWRLRQSADQSRRATDRKQQVGSGMRGDKRRTIRTQDGQVNDHITGRKWLFRDYVRGNW